MRKLLTVLTLATGVTLATPAMAQARPVPDPVIEVGDCGPGLDWKVFSLTDPRGYTVTCLDEPSHPIYQKPVLRPSMDHWWNPWSWFN